MLCILIQIMMILRFKHSRENIQDFRKGFFRKIDILLLILRFRLHVVMVTISSLIVLK